MLSELLAGWIRHDAGGGVRLTPPDEDLGSIRIFDRLPRGSVRDLIARVSDVIGARVDVTPPVPIVTREGEHASYFECAITEGDRAVHRCVGAIFADHHTVLIDGHVANGAPIEMFRAVVREITHGYCVGVGPVRWRPYFYRAPRGWQGITRVQGELWLNPRYPRDPARLAVFHARPLGTEHVRRMIFEMPPRDMRVESGPTSIGSFAHGLTGKTAELVGDGRRITTCVLEDARFLYPMQLEWADGSSVADIIHEVAASIRPVPAPTVQSVSGFEHWAM